jgi:dimethylamine/trimethylamine dehydrogenase
MESARVLGVRGFRNVHLVEASGTVGGSMAWISALSGLPEWRRYVDRCQSGLDSLPNVTTILNHTVTAQDVLEYGASIVLVATGSRWAHDGMNQFTGVPVDGARQNLDFVRTPEEVVAGATIGRQAVVYDADGYLVGIGIAQKLLREGHRITYVTPFEKVAPRAGGTWEAINVERTLGEPGLRVLCDHVVTAVDHGSITIRRAQGTTTVAADTIVMVTQRNPIRDLYSELLADPAGLAAAGIIALRCVGDCAIPTAAPRS